MWALSRRAPRRVAFRLASESKSFASESKSFASVFGARGRHRVESNGGFRAPRYLGAIAERADGGFAADGVASDGTIEPYVGAGVAVVEPSLRPSADGAPGGSGYFYARPTCNARSCANVMADAVAVTWNLLPRTEDGKERQRANRVGNTGFVRPSDGTLFSRPSRLLTALSTALSTRLSSSRAPVFDWRRRAAAGAVARTPSCSPPRRTRGVSPFAAISRPVASSSSMTRRRLIRSPVACSARTPSRAIFRARVGARTSTENAPSGRGGRVREEPGVHARRVPCVVRHVSSRRRQTGTRGGRRRRRLRVRSGDG